MFGRDTSSSPSVGIIFGGVGPEHGVSCLSARSITQAVHAQGIDPLCIGISTSGQWTVIPLETVLAYSTDGDLMPSVSPSPHVVALHLDPQSPGFLVGGKFIPCHVVFPVVHGLGGEDGSLQGLLETAGITYVGSGVEASAICMNKVTAKSLVHNAGIETGNWSSINWCTSGSETRVDSSWAWSHFGGSPLFVKPVAGGSSAGISRVNHPSEWDAACDIASKVSDQLIIEVAVQNPRELEVAVLETESGITASPVGEIKVRSGFDFYDFDAKYLADGAELVTPADLDPLISERIRLLAIEIFRVLGCRDYARVDFFLDHNSQLIFNEINTVPGFTSISMFSRMWATGGVAFPELVNQLIGNAAARSTNIPEADS
jgi:D-alanine-D-alanine ligase